MKRRYFTVIIAGAVFLLALILTVYPIISDGYNQRHQSTIHTAYEEVIQKTDAEDLSEQWELAMRYNATIKPGTAEAQYSQSVLLDAAESYDELLNVSGSGIMGYVEIPKIQVNLPIYHGTDTDSLDRGTGHLLGSSLPVGGESTHCVITGHSGLASQKMFTDLELLEVGDVFYLSVLGETLAYQVYSKEAVLPHDTYALGIAQGEDLCTLITCYPTGVNTHRLLVQGKRVAYEEETEIEIIAEPEKVVSSKWENQYLFGLLLGVWCALAGAAVCLSVKLYRRKCRAKGGRYVKKTDAVYQ